MKIIAAILLIALGYLAFTTLLPFDETWLHGEWQYTGDDEDYMTFHGNGTVELRNDQRVYLRCVYAVVVKDEVRMECEVRGETRELVFEVSDDRRTLTNIEYADSIYRKIAN